MSEVAKNGRFTVTIEPVERRSTIVTFRRWPRRNLEVKESYVEWVASIIDNTKVVTRADLVHPRHTQASRPELVTLTADDRRTLLTEVTDYIAAIPEVEAMAERKSRIRAALKGTAATCPVTITMEDLA